MGNAAVNDFTIRVATVNGSGSQSSNLVLTNAIFRLGVPVAPKNVFPSNIEGLPTWYDIRATSRGYRCRTQTIDLLVALNAATWVQDVASVRSGGAIVYESTYPVSGLTQRDDLAYFPVPFTELAKAHVKDGAMRKYLTNMIYVGVIAELLHIPEATIEAAIGAQFKSKPKAAAANLEAVRIGSAYAREHLSALENIAVEPMTGATDELFFIDGNRAAALGSLMGGCTVSAWYPITPASSLCESFISLCEKYRVDPVSGERKYAIVQAEDELAAIGMIVGAGWAGARSMTATSGPGISLMAEYVGYASFAEIPAVIFDVQRVGPSTGLPTRTMQGDVSFVYTLGHGDTKHPVLLPGTVEELYEDGMAALDLAERLQCPVFVLSDLDLGMNSWLTKPFAFPEKPFDRGKVLGVEELNAQPDWGRYRDVDGDGIPYRTLPGTDHPAAGYFTRGTGHDEEAKYSENPDVWLRNLNRLARKHDTARTLVPQPQCEDAGHAVDILAYGSTHHAVVEARDLLHAAGLETDYLRVRALPLAAEIAEFIARHETVYVVEQNRDGQLYGILRNELLPEHIARLRSVRHYNGVPIDASAIVEPLLESKNQLAHAGGARS